LAPVAEPTPQAVARSATRLDQRIRDACDRRLEWNSVDRQDVRVLLQFVAVVTAKTGYSRRVDGK
jgi:hypothetical protein